MTNDDPRNEPPQSPAAPLADGPVADAPVVEPGPAVVPGASSSTTPTPSLILGAPAGGLAPIGPGSTSRGTVPHPAGSAGSSSRQATPVPLAWRSWPVIDSPAEFVCLVGAMLGVPYVVWDATGSPIAALLCTAALATVVWRNFVPTLFEIGALGVTERFVGRTRRIPWISIDRFVVGRKGAFLSSAGAPLEVLRGFYLPWGPHREQVLTTLRYYLPRAEDPPPAEKS